MGRTCALAFLKPKHPVCMRHEGDSLGTKAGAARTPRPVRSDAASRPRPNEPTIAAAGVPRRSAAGWNGKPVQVRRCPRNG